MNTISCKLATAAALAGQIDSTITPALFRSCRLTVLPDKPAWIYLIKIRDRVTPELLEYLLTP